MSSQIPFAPVTAGALSRLTPAEREAFTTAAEQVAGSQKPPMMTIVTLIETVHRLITEPGAGDGAKLAEIHQAVVDGFLGAYGQSDLASFKVAIDLASSVRTILDGSGVASRERVTAEAVAAERERIRRGILAREMYPVLRHHDRPEVA